MQAVNAAARRSESARRLAFARHFLVLWLPGLLILAAVIWAFYTVQAKSALALLKASEREAIQLSVQASLAESATVRSDLLYLSDQYSLLDDGSRGASEIRAALASRYSAFARRKKVYGHVRLLDVGGHEVVRVDWKDGKPATVPRGRLQDVSRSEYYRAALALARGQIYVSPLAIAQDTGPQALRPAFRLATPVYDQGGNKRGIIVLDYLAEQFLGRLRSIHRSDRQSGSIWLLTPGGRMVLDQHGEEGARPVLRDGACLQLSRRDPEAWRLIRSGTGGEQFVTDQGLYTYAWINPPTPPGSMPASAAAGRNLLLAYKPMAAVEALDSTLARRLWLVFGFLALLFAFAVWAITFYSMQRREAEEEVRASEARFRALLESAPDAIVIADPDGRIVLANAQAERYFGYTREELLHQAIEILVPESLRTHHVSHRANYAADPYTRPMGAGLELFGRRKDGSEFPIEISLSPLQTPQGMVVTAIVRDISARKQIERQRMEAQVRYRELMDNLPVGVYRKTAGADGQFLEVNPALVGMLEAESAEMLLERSLATFRTADGQPLFREDESRLDAVVNAELEMRTLKGRPFCGAINARLKREPDGGTYYDGIIEDVTARKETERQLERRTAELEAINRELEAFSYSVSHDLRAPLRAIDGFSRILLTDYAERLDETGRDRLGRIRRAAQHMGTLIDDLLKLSRVTRTELKREDVDLSALATDIANELRRLAPEREIAFSIAPALRANGDRGLLRIVLDNLLGNAWKFTGGRSDARIALEAENPGGETVYVVSDNGAGFDMAYANKLFGVFQRLHDATEFPGTGIGLATVQRIVHKHGGRIWAESEVGKGARFYFTLEAEGAS
ncbi:sensor histidine kinase [Thiobacillus sp.]